MLLVAEHVRLGEHVAVPADVESPRRIRLDDLRHLVIELVALRRRWHAFALLIELIVLGNRRAGGVILVDVLAVEKLHKVAGVRIIGDPRRGAHHQLALLLELEHLGKFNLLHLHPDPDQIEGLGPKLVLLSAQRFGARCIHDHQRLAIRQGSEAAGGLPVTKAVEQRVGAHGVELDARPVARVVAHDARRNRELRLDRLAVAHDPDLVVDVERHRHRAAQRDLLLG